MMQISVASWVCLAILVETEGPKFHTSVEVYELVTSLEYYGSCQRKSSYARSEIHFEIFVQH